MGFIDGFRERRGRRRERIRKVLFGDTPRPKPLERVLLVSSVVVGGFVCYRFQLVHAHSFALIGFACLMTYFVVRRIWLRRKPAPDTGGSS